MGTVIELLIKCLHDSLHHPYSNLNLKVKKASSKTLIDITSNNSTAIFVKQRHNPALITSLSIRIHGRFSPGAVVIGEVDLVQFHFTRAFTIYLCSYK